MSSARAAPSLPFSVILKTWWPLAASWLLMGAEVPLLSAVMARLADPEVHLAAYGGVVYPLALIIEAPIIMILAASVALSKDWASYLKIKRFTHAAGATLTALHALIVFTPLYDLIVRGLIRAPEEVVMPARLGLAIMLPWTWSIAYRRFQQGVLIRFGHSKAVGVGTLVRLTADVVVLAVGYSVARSSNGSLPGIVVGTAAQAAGVISEAVFAGLVVQPVLRGELRPAPTGEPLTLRFFADFYIPLVFTELLSLLWQPIGSAALSRMPQALPSLAVWPVVSGLIMILRSFGYAYNEVVVALLDEVRSYPSLKRFTTILAGGSSALHLLMVATPLAAFWFGRVSALPAALASLASTAFWLGLPMGGLTVLQSWYQGALLFGRKTHGVSESVAVSLGVVLLVLGAGVVWGKMTGLYVGMAAFSLAALAQTAWLWLRSRPVMRLVRARDEALFPLEAAAALSREG
jgi:hypothetical protein